MQVLIQQYQVVLMLLVQTTPGVAGPTASEAASGVLAQVSPRPVTFLVT